MLHATDVNPPLKFPASALPPIGAAAGTIHRRSGSDDCPVASNHGRTMVANVEDLQATPSRVRPKSKGMNTKYFVKSVGGERWQMFARVITTRQHGWLHHSARCDASHDLKVNTEHTPPVALQRRAAERKPGSKT